MMKVVLITIVIVGALLALMILFQILASFRRRTGDLPPDLLDGELPNGDEKPGMYLGTFQKGWKKPLDPSGLLRKGPGKFWVDEKGVNFLVNHAFQPVFLPFSRIFDSGVEPVNMRKYRDEKALVVHWMLDGKTCRSAFLVKDEDHHKLAGRIKESGTYSKAEA